MTTEQAKTVLENKMSLKDKLDLIPELKAIRAEISGNLDPIDTFSLSALCGIYAYKHLISVGEIPSDKIYNMASQSFSAVNWPGDLGCMGDKTYRYINQEVGWQEI